MSHENTNITKHLSIYTSSKNSLIMFSFQNIIAFYQKILILLKMIKGYEIFRNCHQKLYQFLCIYIYHNLQMYHIIKQAFVNTVNIFY